MMLLYAYLIGWFIRVPFQLRVVMQWPHCRECKKMKGDHNDDQAKRGRWEKPHDFDPVPLGAIRARTGKDAALAMWLALFWPITVLAYAWSIVWRLAKALLFRTPLTAAERERVSADRQKDIERLTKKIREES